MEIVKKIWTVIAGILLAVGKLMYLAVKMVLCLFLLVVQMVLAIFHGGSSD